MFDGYQCLILKGMVPGFIKKIQEYVGYRECGTGGTKQRIGKNQEREVYVILKLSAYLLFLVPGITSGESIQ